MVRTHKVISKIDAQRAAAMLRVGFDPDQVAGQVGHCTRVRLERMLAHYGVNMDVEVAKYKAKLCTVVSNRENMRWLVLALNGQSFEDIALEAKPERDEAFVRKRVVGLAASVGIPGKVLWAAQHGG